MSTSIHYEFINSSALSEQNRGPKKVGIQNANSTGAPRQVATSPSSFTTSSSDSSSSLNSQFTSLTSPNSGVSTSIPYSSASSTSSSSSSSTASNSNLVNHAHHATTTVATNRSLNLYPRDQKRQSPTIPTQVGSYQFQTGFTLHSLEAKTLKPFKSQNAYIDAMKEDLAEWLNSIYPDLELTPENFFSQLDTGAIICRHANNVTQTGRNAMIEQSSSSSDAASSGSDNDNSLNNETNFTSLSSPSPECGGHKYESRINQLYQRHRHSTTNSSISSLATACSSTSKHRLSLTGSSSGSTVQDRTIDWFRVRMLTYKSDARPGTFFARDNICQFILWCRSLNILECLLFETDDLVSRKNEKSFILCLLEVARIGFKVGMSTPLIIQLEQEIDREIENDAKLQRQEERQQQSEENGEGYHQVNAQTCIGQDSNDSCGESQTIQSALTLDTESPQSLELNNNQQTISETNGKPVEPSMQEDNYDECHEEDIGPKPQVITNDLLSLHERVVQLLCQCTCSTQFPMVRIGDGKYKVGDKLIIFIRILRRHMMVRVGGGWQELSEFLRQKDPCRTKDHHNSFSHHQTAKLATPPPLLASLQPSTITANTTSIPVSRSRLVGSSHHLNKNYQNHGNVRGSGQKLISGSVSMSWLSHNS